MQGRLVSFPVKNVERNKTPTKKKTTIQRRIISSMLNPDGRDVVTGRIGNITGGLTWIVFISGLDFWAAAAAAAAAASVCRRRTAADDVGTGDDVTEMNESHELESSVVSMCS